MHRLNGSTGLGKVCSNSNSVLTLMKKIPA
jgi:hypothetical protein